MTGGEALRNYGVVAQPGDSASSMKNKVDGMITQIDRTIKQNQILYGLPEIDSLTLSDFKKPGKNSDFDVRSISIDATEEQNFSDLAKSAFGSYEPDKYDYRRNPDTGQIQRKKKDNLS